MFDSQHVNNLHLQHVNPSTIHPLAFIPSKEFMLWLDTISTNNSSKQDSEADNDDDLQ